MGILLVLGFVFYFWVVSGPAGSVQETPLCVEALPEISAPVSPPPATVRDHYEFAGGDVFFDEAVEPAFVAASDNAVSSLLVTTYTIGESPAVEALNRAAARGVKVKVVAGRSKFEKKPTFSFIEFHPPQGILHEKILVADGYTVFLSSRNLTAGSSKNAAILFHHVPRMANLLSEEISSLEEMRIVRRCDTGCPVEYGTIYFLPGKGCRAGKEFLLSAKERVEIAVYTITPGTPLMTGIKKSLRAGRAVYAILDDWSGEQGRAVNRRAGDYLDSLGAKVWYDHLTSQDGRPLNFHHKFAVIDGGEGVLFGSMNWTKSGCYRNREVLFISRDHDISSIFASYFDDIRRAVSGEKKDR